VTTLETPVRPRRRSRWRSVRRRGWDVLGLAVFAVMIFPVFWMLSTAFKPDDEINSATPTWFSLSPTLDHFRDAMARDYFWDTVRNSLIVVCIAVLASLVIAFLAAVALAKYRFSGRTLLIVLMIGIIMLPQAGLGDHSNAKCREIFIAPAHEQVAPVYGADCFAGLCCFLRGPAHHDNIWIPAAGFQRELS